MIGQKSRKTDVAFINKCEGVSRREDRWTHKQINLINNRQKENRERQRERKRADREIDRQKDTKTNRLRIGIHAEKHKYR